MSAERSGTVEGALYEVRVQRATQAPAEAVYDLLADLETHLEWGGRRQKSRKFRLTSIEAPAGVASVGTEFRTTGLDPTGTFSDSSVVTESSRPEVFEFVTEARLTPKRGEILEWTNVSRYEIARRDQGCEVRYSMRVMRLSRRPWWIRPLFRGLAQRMSASYVRAGLANLVGMAEDRAGIGSPRS